MEPDLISTRQARRLLGGVGNSTFHRWVISGRLPQAFKVEGPRGPRLFHRADVERLRDELRAELTQRIADMDAAS